MVLYRIYVESEDESRHVVCEGIPDLGLVLRYAKETMRHFDRERELEVSIERYFESDGDEDEEPLPDTGALRRRFAEIAEAQKKNG